MSDYTIFAQANPGTDYPTKDANLRAQLTLDTDKVDFAGPGYQFGHRRNASAGLNIAWYGGNVNNGGAMATVADGTTALTDAATNYVEHDAAGVVTKNTSAFTAGKFPMMTAVTAGGAIGAVTDRRAFMPTNARLYFDGTQLTAHTLAVSTGNLTAAGDFAVAATKKLYLDGVAASGDTYILESSANVVDVFAGGVGTLRVTASAITVTGGVTSTAQNTFNNTTAVRSPTIANSHASTPFGFSVVYGAAAPNGTANEFLLFDDNAATRGTWRSNGGIANYSANNVNLSDVRVKPSFELLRDNSALMAKLWAAHMNVDWGRFKYADQTHDDWNYGYSAQGVGRAFAEVAPTLIDEWQPEIERRYEGSIEIDGVPHAYGFSRREANADGMLAVYTEDLKNIGGALLAEAQRRIVALEAAVARLQ